MLGLRAGGELWIYEEGCDYERHTGNRVEDDEAIREPRAAFSCSL